MIGCEDRLRNDLYCVGWGDKLCSTSTSTVMFFFSFRLCVMYELLHLYVVRSVFECFLCRMIGLRLKIDMLRLVTVGKYSCIRILFVSYCCCVIAKSLLIFSAVTLDLGLCHPGLGVDAENLGLVLCWFQLQNPHFLGLSPDPAGGAYSAPRLPSWWGRVHCPLRRTPTLGPSGLVSMGLRV